MTKRELKLPWVYVEGGSRGGCYEIHNNEGDCITADAIYGEDARTLDPDIAEFVVKAVNAYYNERVARKAKT